MKNVIVNKKILGYALILAATLALVVIGIARAQGVAPTMSWFTVNGGGGTFSTGGSFSVGGTAGQPDAGNHSGGDFALRGGFWASQPVTIVEEAVRPQELPDTGFAPDRVTKLPAHPANLAYTSTDIILNIPKLGVEMPIVGVPLVAGEWDASWLSNSAGWLEGTTYPTFAGNTVITGHVWDALNQPGAFRDLKNLQYGDQFTITTFGSVYTYEVRDSQRVSPWNMSVLGQSDYDIVTLLTCEDYNDQTGEYRYRRAVTAVLIDISPE